MLEKPVITLTTDFGFKGPFAGVMKGVILTINPKAKIVDLSHSISAHNILEASQIISMSYKNFPVPSIHVVVVDPGVGGLRKPLLVITEDHYFIGPDNGVFTSIFEEHKDSALFKVIHMSSSHFYRTDVSSTFHGRDIFAPSAAWLSKGVDSSKFGEEVSDYVTVPTPKVMPLGETAFEGEVVYIDSFGNSITNLTKNELSRLDPELSGNRFKITYKGNQLNLFNYYAEQEQSELSAIINSFGFLELFTYKGNASAKFSVKTGDKISVSLI